jgi:hypothetical protein
MRNSNASVALMAGLMAAASMPAVGGNVEVIPRADSYDPGYRKGRRSRAPESTGNYPGAKLAKKARKGTLTHNGIR